jgi:surface antigen/LysM repeat protein
LHRVDVAVDGLLGWRGLTLHTVFRFDARGGIVGHRATRLVTHAVVLVVAVGLASYSSTSRGLPQNLLRLGFANPQARSIAQGGQVDNVSLGREGVVLKPMQMPTELPVRHDPISYTVAAGDDLKSVASRFNVTVDEILWSNPSLGTSTRVQPGQILLVPPIAGVVVQVRRGDSLQSLGTFWHVDPASIEDFNYLRNPAAELTDGRLLVLPAGRGSTLTPQPSGANLPAAIGSRTIFAIKVGGTIGPYPVTRFPFGQCTWFVATEVPVPWMGNAYQWYAAAQAANWPVGTMPRAGAIMVTWESRVYGHVAYVQSVNADGSWNVAEMNYVGWGVVDQRRIRPGQVPLIGFIYQPT